MVVVLLFAQCKGGEQQGKRVSTEEAASKEKTSVNTPLEGGALIGTRFSSLEELKSVITIEYVQEGESGLFVRPCVLLHHKINGKEVLSHMEKGISQLDYIRVREGGFWDKVGLGLSSFYATCTIEDMRKVYYLARRKRQIFGQGDVAFYDLAETMMCHIHEDDLAFGHVRDTTEKGYINTFNHITAQAFMTSIFSERLADFVADVHERQKPELVTGDFTADQLADLDEGPVDNYVDMVNNEWGQELGKRLRKKHQIDRYTQWTPQLLTDYLNDIQDYYSRALSIDFVPFKVTDELVIRYADKINAVMDGDVLPK